MDPKLDVSKAYSRRGLLKLGAVAGAAAGSAALGFPLSANAATGSGLTTTGSGQPMPQRSSGFTRLQNTAGSITPGTTYVEIGGITAFKPRSSASGFAQGNSGGGIGIFPTIGTDYFIGSLPLPPGATLTEFVYSFLLNDANGVSLELDFQASNVDTNLAFVSYHTQLGSIQSVALTFTPTTIPVDSFVIPYFGFGSTGGAKQQLFSARAGYIHQPGFHAITPARVYDTRSSGGPLAAGATRAISVATALVGGATVVPSGATAILYNLTVTNTAAAGYLALFPFGATWPGNSSINWTGPNQTLANGGTVSLGGDRQINVLDGGGGTDFIVDVTGYFL
ncbi:MAG TPA: hypothetical protein VNG93_08525 [Candidatus Dormibacteraeota bacterium]|nr:hypothetical protein [Candidatus Dormibacteraeota bacterium]